MRILGYDYILDGSKGENEIEAMGRLHPSKHKIQIANDTHKQEQISSILHEILEALKFHLALTLEHDTLTALEAGLFQVLTDNGIDLSPLTKELNE